MTLARFFGATQVGRALVRAFHRWPLHPGWGQPLRFYGHGCPLCKIMVKDLMKHVDPAVFADRSSVKVSEPEYAEDGTLIKRGVSMSSVAERQLKKILEESDPETAQKLQEAIDKIARDG